MRKRINLLLLLAAMLLPMATRAQDSLIVADGTATNSYVPLYGLYMDDYNRSQFVYPASMLEDLPSGSSITELKFFCSSSPSEAWTSSMSVKMTEVDFTTFSGTTFVSTDDADVLFTGTLNATSGTMTLTLDDSYVYSGGNLLVEVYSNTDGNYKSCSWLGIASNGSSLMGYSSSGLSSITPSQRNFLPKVQISYVSGGASVCRKPSNVAISNITADGATLTWNSRDEHNGYTLMYHTANFNPDSADADVVSDYPTDTTYDFVSLNPTTTYYVKIKASCSDGGESGWISTSFRTTGIPYTEGFPYTTGFEEDDDTGWEFANGANGWFLDSAVNNGGSKAIYISNDNGATNGYNNSSTSKSWAYRTLQIEQAGDYAISFDWRANGESTWDYLRAFFVPASEILVADVLPGGVSSTSSFSSTTPTGWIDLGSGKLNLSTSWQTNTTIFQVPSAGNYNLVFLWCNDGSSGTQPSAAVDNIVLTQLTCPAPVNLTISDITADGATISWTALGEESQWAISVNGGDWETATDTSYTFTTLESNTAYSVVVKAVCGVDDSSFSISGSFRTACGGYTDIPYFEDFEGYNTDDVPNCWVQIATGSNSGHTFPSVYNYTSNTYHGDGYFEFESAASSSDTEIVALPEMEDISNLKLIFWASMSSSYPCTLEAGVLESDGTFTPVQTINLITFTGTSSWKQNYHEYTVYFTNYSGNGERIALRATRPGTSQYTLFLDDLMVAENNGCYPLVSVSAYGVDSSSVALTWVDTLNTGITYTVSYWTAGGDTTEVNGISDTSYTVDGLDANTVYNFIVTPNCSEGDGIPSTAQARTACGTASIPYSEGFEGMATMAAPNCWTVLSGMIYVRNIDAGIHSGTRYLDFRGSSTGDTVQLVALPPMNQPTNELQVRFWTRPESFTSSSCGTLTVGYMTDIDVDSTFVGLATWSYNEFTAYEEKEVPMIGAPDDARIAFRRNAPSYNWYWYVDDLVVEPIPQCPHPTSVTASNVTANEADITIVGTDGASFRLWWTDGTTTDSTDLTGNTYSFTSLTGSTAYTVTVATICDDGSLTSTVSTSFRTECEAGSCDVVIDMEDSFGDGWNNAAILGYIENEQVFSATLSSGNSTGTYTYSLCASDSLVLKWYSGSFDDEASFSITHGGNALVSGSGDDYSTGSVIASVSGCPACISPSGFALDSVTATEAIFHWNAGEAAEWMVVVNGDTTNAIITTSNSVTLTSLTASTTYTVAISTLCGDDETSMPLIGSFRTDCADGSCDVIVNMVDSYGDGWNGNAISGYANGELVFSVTIDDGYNNTYTYGLCSNDTLVLTWITGSYPGETSFEVTVGGAVIANGGGGSYSTGDTLGFTYGCPSCYAPTNFVLDSVGTDEATFHWTVGNEETEWIVVVNDTAVVVNTNSITVTGLSPNTSYTVAVSSICAVGDTSMAMNASFRTACGAIATLPWTEDFAAFATTSSATNIPCWNYIGFGGYVNITSSNSHSDNCLRFYPNSSSSTDHIMVLPEFAMDISGLELSFWTRPESASSSGSFSVGYVTDPTADSTFVEVINIPCSMGTTYTQYDVVFTTAPAGSYIAMRHNVGSTSWYWFVDDIDVHVAPTCPAPHDIVVDNADASSVTFHWTPSGAESEWEVTVDGTTTYVSSPSATVSGLDALTVYPVSVRGICGEGDTSLYLNGSITSGFCDNSVTAESWDSTMTGGTSTYSPIGYSLYNYSYVQTIIDSAILAEANLTGAINAFAFNASGTSGSNQFQNMTVFMANVSESDLSSSWIVPDSAHTFVKVIDSADFNFNEEGWQTHAFDNDFIWDGHSNILVSVKRDNGTYSGSQQFTYHTTSVYKTRYAYRDGSAYDYTNPDVSGTATYSRGDIRLVSCGAGCATPTVTVSNVEALSATITATGSGNGYELLYGTDDATYGNTLTSTDGVFTLTGLQPETQYYYAVRQLCDSGAVSNWATGSFTTIDLGCLAPTGLNVVATGYTDVTLNWTVGNEETAWEVHVFSTTIDTVVPATATTTVVNGLAADLPYSAAVRALCGDGTIPGPWSDTVSFTTQACQAVTEVTVSATATTATVSWTGTSTSYRVIWGLQPFNPQDLAGEATVTTNSYTITGLDPEEDYAVVVYNNCAEGVSVPSATVNFSTVQGSGNIYTITATANNSAWGTVTGSGSYEEGSSVTLTATPNEGYTFVQWVDASQNVLSTDNPYVFNATANVTITAIFQGGEQGIDDVVTGTMSLYPNPASTSVTLGLEGFEGVVDVDVVDMNGRVVYKTNTTSTTVSFDVSELPQGAYFVRVVSGTQTAVRKLVVK